MSDEPKEILGFKIEFARGTLPEGIPPELVKPTLNGLVTAPTAQARTGNDAPDLDDIFTRADIEPATQALLARFSPQDCDGIPSEVANASALLDRVCEVLGVPLVDLLRTVEAMPRWVPVESVKDGTVFHASARPPHWLATTYEGPSGFRGPQTMAHEWREALQDSYILIGGLYPPHPKVTR